MMSNDSRSVVLEFLSQYSDRMRNLAAIVLFVCIFGLSIFGIVMMYSTSSALFGEEKLIKQAQWVSLGMVSAGILFFCDYRLLCRYRKLILFGAFLPLAYLATAFVMNKAGVSADVVAKMPLVRRVNGAYRWLFIGPFSIQPGEFAKLALIIFLASYYGENPRRARKFVRGILIPLLGIGFILTPMLLGGSLSITMITAAVAFCIMFVAGVRLRYFFLMTFGSLMLVLSVLIISPERMKRVSSSWLDPESHKKAAGYQLSHSWYAMGSGDLKGVGLNNSRMKEGYLPFSWTDFIMAIVGEELGFIGMMSVMLAFIAMVASAFFISVLAADRQGLLLGVGIGFAIGFHALTNYAVVSGALPTTGVTIPLISYGGSNVLLTWLGIGLLGSIVRISRKVEYDTVIDELGDRWTETSGYVNVPGAELQGKV
jgi:cell division protein FtsW